MVLFPFSNRVRRGMRWFSGGFNRVHIRQVNIPMAATESEQTEPFTTRIPPQMKQAMRVQAAREGRTMSELGHELLAEAWERYDGNE